MKLSEDDVQEIRESMDLPTEIAKRYDITRSHVINVQSGRYRSRGPNAFRYGVLSYVASQGEGKVSILEAFHLEHKVVKMEIISEWIRELEDLKTKIQRGHI